MFKRVREGCALSTSFEQPIQISADVADFPAVVVEEDRLAPAWASAVMPALEPAQERADEWGHFDVDITNAEATEILRKADSGITPDLSRYGYRFVKRAFDIAASGAAIAILLVPGVVLSAIICIKSPGAGPFYSQIRVGRLRKDGTYKLFRMWKFRSMIPNADAMLKDLKVHNEADGPLFKIKDDPRIIPGVGHFIRKHSLDELPQLLNVLSGDMSLIGPCPGLPREVVQYDKHSKGRLVIKPGCGGPWQVGGRSNLGFEEMVRLDLEYIENRSLKQDIELIFDTIRTMFTGKGAA